MPFDKISHRGLGVGSGLQYEAVKSIFGDNCILYTLPNYEKYSFKSLETLLFHRYEGISRKEENNIISYIRNNNIDIVYIDNSFWGELVNKIRRKCDVQVIIFCQDIEQSRVSSILSIERKNKQWIKFLWHHYWLYIVKKNEKKAIELSDAIITLNSRDSKELFRLYYRKSTFEIPVCLKDDYDAHVILPNPYNPDKVNLLFVGAMDYLPNIEAVEFMKKKVIPFTRGAVFNVIGKGAVKHKCGNINIIGEVNDLTPYYIYANAVVLPIFSGGGMKIKTAEALKYGKKILGTREAFEGYNIEYDKVGALCNSADDFVENIVKIKKDYFFNKYSQEVFKRNYSFEVLKQKYTTFFENLTRK